MNPLAVRLTHADFRTGLGAWQPLRLLAPAPASAALFLLATLAAFWGHQSGHQVTAALVYVVGVTCVGSLSGLRGGILAALAASIIFNFFLSEPLYRFSMTSPDEAFPLAAFAIGAVISGSLAGRLNDKARAAERSKGQLELLLFASRALQTPVRVADVSRSIASFVGNRPHAIPELFVVRGDRLEAVEGGRNMELAQQLLRSGAARLCSDRYSAFLVSSRDGPLGIIVVDGPLFSTAGDDAETDAFLNVFSLAIERCLLLERVSETEAVRASEALKTALLSSVSHDMRTPLAAISASASSLASYSDDLSEDVRASLLRTIDEQCGRLNRYTTNLLSLSRIQSGVRAGDLQSVDALDVLGTAVSRARALGFPHTIEKRLHSGEAIVFADPVMLEQVFYNVIENALQHTDGGVVTIATAEIDDCLAIAVSDEGSGISVAEAEKVFDRFYRGDGSGGREGSGLGLSIAKGFIEAFGGSIAVRSRDDAGSGACFSIQLPLRQGEIG